MRLLSVLLISGFSLLAETTYQKPPQPVLDILHAPVPPLLSVNPPRTYVLLLQGERYPSIADVSRPMLRLAGLRIDPRTSGPHREPHFVSAALRKLPDGKDQPLSLPPGVKLSGLRWSPDGTRFAFLNTTDNAIELWIGDAATGALHQAPGVTINAVMGDALNWLADNRTLLLQLVPAGRAGAPVAREVPAGPHVQEGAGKSAPVRTYQDLLQNPHDEMLFDYYATAQLAFYDVVQKQLRTVGDSAIFSDVQPAPDGQHLLVARLHRPYSYLQPAAYFPRETDVWNQSGQQVFHLASQPLADQIPIDGVRTGPRGVTWKPTEPAALVWVEALDGGNPKETVPHRDRVLTVQAPFRDQPVELMKVEHRFAGLDWTEQTSAAIIQDFERNKRWVRTSLMDPGHPAQSPVLLNSRNIQDRYRNPGALLRRTLPNGLSAIWQDGDYVFLSGLGATPQGDRPFLDRLNLKTQKTERLFRCDETHYETVETLLDNTGERVLTRREGPSEPPNYYIRNTRDGSLTALTHFTDPAPQLRQVQKQLVTYKRADGVPLSFTLYLPPNYKPGTRLPTVFWAYPLEYNDADTAGQIGGSTQRFTTINGYSHLFFLLQGYAVLDNVAMPVVGDPETANNTYLEQIVSSAKAAIEKAAEMGVTDPQRVGVGGHSYGAFMTANLLAHSDLFRAGIARSGAYNRTLTPFGFQSERRTLWEAPDLYFKMSPFLSADKIKEPILLVHGEADNNMGTFPIQSERMYQAIRGNGGTVRLVMLPHEAHAYIARESVEHVLAEMVSWFDKYVKEAPEAAGIANRH